MPLKGGSFNSTVNNIIVNIDNDADFLDPNAGGQDLHGNGEGDVIKGTIKINVKNGKLSDIRVIARSMEGIESDIRNIENKNLAIEININNGTVEDIFGYSNVNKKIFSELIFKENIYKNDSKVNVFVRTILTMENIIVEGNNHVNVIPDDKQGIYSSPINNVENLIIKRGGSIGLKRQEKGEIKILKDLILDGGKLRLIKRDEALNLTNQHLHVGGMVRGEGQVSIKANDLSTLVTPELKEPYIIAENTHDDETDYKLRNEDLGIYLAKDKGVVNQLNGNNSPTHDIYYIAGRDISSKKYTIISKAGTGGSISPEGNIEVKKGERAEFIIKPNPGYKLTDIKVDGESIKIVDRYEFENIEDNHTIEAIFELIKYIEIEKPDKEIQTNDRQEYPSRYSFDRERRSENLHKNIDLYKILDTDSHKRYILGYPDKTVRPNNNISRGEVAAILFRLLTDKARAEYASVEGNLKDVTDIKWYKEEVDTLVNIGIISGYPDLEFKGENNITRGEFAKIVAEFNSAKYNKDENLFTDIDNHWASNYINRAAVRGWIKGYKDNTFKPDEYITRAEAISLINSVLDRNKIKSFLHDMTKYQDNIEGVWYYEDIQEAVNSHKYTKDKDNYETWTELIKN